MPPINKLYNQLSSDQLSSDQFSSDQLNSDQLSSDQHSSDQLSSDQLSSDQLSSDQPRIWSHMKVLTAGYSVVERTAGLVVGEILELSNYT